MNRRLIAASLLMMLCLLLAAAVLAEEKQAPPKPPTYTGLKHRIGVLPITVAGATSTTTSRYGDETYTTTTQTTATPVPGGLGASLTEQLTTALINTGRFIVLERQAIGDVLGEQDFGASGRVNVETAAPTGKVIGADWLIKAAITEYEEKKSRSAGGVLFRGVGIGGTKSEAYLAMDLRIVDAATGEVLDSVKADGRAKQSGALGGIKIGEVVLAGGKQDKTPIGQATRAALTDAVDFICARMEKIPWRSRVITVEGQDVLFTGGKDMNVRVGSLFEVVHPGQVLVDPETGRMLGSLASHLGTLRVTGVQDKFSIGCMIEGPAPARADIVRTVPLASTAAPPAAPQPE
jgi:curli biogenesis system outer membrane secretion channel CsgG